MLTQEAKQEIIEKFAVHEGDTGSPEVQIAVLTARNPILQFLLIFITSLPKNKNFKNFLITKPTC